VATIEKTKTSSMPVVLKLGLYYSPWGNMRFFGDNAEPKP